MHIRATQFRSLSNSCCCLSSQWCHLKTPWSKKSIPVTLNPVYDLSLSKCFLSKKQIVLKLWLESSILSEYLVTVERNDLFWTRINLQQNQDGRPSASADLLGGSREKERDKHWRMGPREVYTLLLLNVELMATTDTTGDMASRENTNSSSLSF